MLFYRRADIPISSRFVLSPPRLPTSFTLSNICKRILIGESHCKLQSLNEDQQRLKYNIESAIEASHCEALSQAVAQRRERVRLEIERKHEQKLNRPPARMDVDELKKRWVVNISGRRLQSNEISLLRKGLNFAITPHIVPTKDILASVEAAICHLPREGQDAIRAEVYGALKHAKPPKQRNLTNEERRALKELKTDENNVIVRADKGNCTVVMECRLPKPDSRNAARSERLYTNH